MTLDEIRRIAAVLRPARGPEESTRTKLALVTLLEMYDARLRAHCSADFYIAGPMRGYEKFNFPAFDKAAEDLAREGLTVVSPAQMDRDDGFDPAHGEDIPIEDVIRRDVDAILGCRGIYLLRGWERSVGATAEFTIAKWAEKDFRYQTREEAHL